MRVLQLTQRFPPAVGGVEEHVHQLTTRLPEFGVGVEVFTTDLRRDLPFDRFEPPIPNGHPGVRHFRAMRVADLPHALGNVAPGMLPAVLAGEWDIIHAHAYGYFPTFAGAFGRMLRHGALVITPHADPGRPTAAKRLFDALVPPMSLRRAERVIALTPREASLLESWGVSPERIAVIPNGVDLAEFAGSADPGRPRDTVTALFVGRCYPRQKGLDILLRAMAEIPANRRLRLRVVGEDWGGSSGLAALARELGLGDRVALVGKLERPDLLREFAGADLFVLPSRFDSFPIVLLEAMAASLPIVATRVGGVPDVVEDGRNGLLVPPEDVGSLARALEMLAADESLRLRMGREGRVLSSRYAWDAIIPKVKRVYEEAMAERAG